MPLSAGNDDRTPAPDLLSRIDDIPPRTTFFVTTLQWFFVLMPSALIAGMMVAPLLYPDPARQMQVIQVMFITTGIFQCLQVVAGHRLPIGFGPTSVLIIGVGAGLAYPLDAIFTSMIVCGLAVALLAALDVGRYLKKVFTFNIVLAVLLMLCFAITPLVLGLIIHPSEPSDPTANLAFAILFTMLILWLAGFLRGMARMLLMPVALVTGAVVYLLFFPYTVPAIDMTPVALPTGVAPTGFAFSLPLICAFFFCYLTVLVVDFSAAESVGLLLGPARMEERYRRGMAVTGLSSVAAAISGAIGGANSSFSMNMIVSSRQGSRYPLAGSGALFILMGLSPVAISLLMATPPVVIACLFIYLLGGILASSAYLAKERTGGIGYDSGLVIGVPLIFAILVSFLPVATKEVMNTRIEPVLANAFIVGVFSALVIEHVFFRGKAELEGTAGTEEKKEG